MNRYSRILIALVVLLGGLALVPFVSLPTQAFGWQRFAGAYQPVLNINYATGQPGSFFALSGSGFQPNSAATISVNDYVLGSVNTDASGQVVFRLNTSQADPGGYTVMAAVNLGATAEFVLAVNEPLRPQEGAGPTFNVPAGIAAYSLLYLPIISR